MAIFPGAVATDSNLYIAVDNLSTLLTDNPLTIGATTVNVVSAALFPSVGFISIDAEIIFYTGKTATSFTGCTRGSLGTTAASHLLNSQVDHNIVSAHHNAPKDEIIAIETFLNTKMGTSGTAYTLSRALQTNAATGIIEVSTVTNTELGFVSGVTSAIQTQLNLKAPLASPVFTGTVTIPSPFTLGATSVTTTGAELNFVAGVTSAIQTQLNAKATDTLVVHLAGAETITGQKTFSSAILNQDGSASLPAYSFSSGTAMGMYRSGANELAFGTNGARRWRILSTGDWVIEGGAATTVQLLAGGGAAATPAYSFNVAGGATTGMYLVATDDLGFSAGGTLRLNINSLGLHGSAFYATQNGTVSGPIYSWDVDTDTGMWRGGANEIDFTAGGTNCMSITAAGVILRGTNTNDSAADAFVGFYSESINTATTNSTGTTQWTDCTSLSLTAGDWDVTGTFFVEANGATWSVASVGISTTSGNSATGLTLGSNRLEADHGNTSTVITALSFSIPTYRISLSATTTVYHKFNCTFSAGTPRCRGRLSARRVR